MPPPRLKRSNTANAAPASLEDGEIAINQADGKLYYRTVAGGVSTVASTPTDHKSTHATGGSDALSAADIGALTQATADTRYVNVTGDTMSGGLTINSANPLVVTGGRSILSAASEPFGLGVKYVSSGGAVYFGATDGTATPGVQISKAGGEALMSWTNAGAASIPGTLTVGGTAVVVSSDSRLSDARTPTAHSHSATDIVSGTLADSRLSGNVVLTTDSRLSDSRTPTSHAHGNISNAGAIGTTAQLPIITTTSGVLTTGAFGTTSGSFCQGNDGRLSDARTPLAHTQAASTITDFATEAAKYGPVTSVNGLTGAVTVSSSGGSISDGIKGDITVSGSGATWTINANAVVTADIADSAVTYAKIQNVSATDRLLGRSTAGAGVVEEIACTSAGRALLDDADAATQRTTLGLGSIATQASNAVAVTGGTINGASIGATTASTGAFTSLSASSDVGIGVNAEGWVRLNVYQNPTNQNGYVTHQVYADPVSTSNGPHTHFLGYFILRTDVAAGVTNSGAHRGCFVSSLRNNKATNNTDAGTLAYLRGAEIQYGHGVQNTSNTPTTTQVTGLHLGPQAGYGTITDMYDLYIAAPIHNVGTVGNHWAIYQAGSAQKNYFAGSVGIGTTTPGSKLEVIPGGGQGINCVNNGGAGTVNYALMGQAAGTAAANTGVYVNATGATSNYGVRIINPSAAANSWAIYSDATAQSYFAGNVGVGVAPTCRLDIAATSTIVNATWAGGTDFVRLLAGSGSAFSEQSISFQELGTNVGAKIGVKNRSNGAYDIVFATRDNSSFTSPLAERMRILSDGNVGIGTTEPGQRLHIAGSGQGIFIEDTGANRAVLSLTVSNTELRIQGTAYNAATQPLTVWTANAERMRISSAGNVGIGTTAPAVQLDVVGAVRASTGILFGTDTATANTLSDYEEGTWTPTFTASTTNPTVTYGTGTTGTYTKIGRLVYANAYIQVSALSSSGAGDLRISGLPFAAPSTFGTWVSAGVIALCADWASSAPARAFVEPGTAYIMLSRLGAVNLQTNTTASDPLIPTSNLTTYSRIALAVTYQT